MSDRLRALQEAIYRDLRRAREDGYRRALKHAGYLPRSIDLAVEKDREWIERGEK